MAYVTDWLALKVEVMHHGLRESDEAFAEFTKDPQALVAFQNLDQSGETHRAKDVARGVAGVLSGAHDFIARDRFGEGQSGIDTQRLAQQDDEEHADQSAHQQYKG